MPRIVSALGLPIMRFISSVVLALTASLWGSTAAAQAAKKAHQHGVATIGVAVEKNRIVVTIDSPLDNLLGFERAPRTDDEKKRAEALVAQMKDGGALFRIDPAAGCKLDTAELQAAVLGVGKPEATSGAHADLEADFEFACADAAKAGFIETTLFSAFTRLQRVNVAVAGTKGQTKSTLRRPATRITIAR
jgi:hypothetical protein